MDEEAILGWGEIDDFSSPSSAPHFRYCLFNSGSPVCSPTRSSLLTGRTPDRECVFNAEGCGQEPAWSCINPQPFPSGWAANESQIFTVANAASDAGYATLHSGKVRGGGAPVCAREPFMCWLVPVRAAPYHPPLSFLSSSPLPLFFFLVAPRQFHA